MEQIGRYIIIKRLGGGGFGEVFLGQDDVLHRDVAIKVFRPKDENLIAFVTSSDAEGETILRERFLNEARILSKLDDAPYVVSVLDFGELEDGCPYYVMPFLDRSLVSEVGRDVFDVAAINDLPEHEKPRLLPLSKAIRYIHQLLHAVSSAHQHGLVHRDIKPANIMLNDKGEIRLVDFGIAKAPEGQHSTVSQLGMGSRNYMAPEQMESAKHVDARADVYAIGVNAYRMLTGRLPKGRFADPNVHATQLNTSLNQLILVCLSEDRDDRPKDATIVLADWEKGMAQDNAPGSVPTTDSDTGTWVGAGESGLKDELKPLRDEIVKLLIEHGEIPQHEQAKLEASAYMVDLDDTGLQTLIKETAQENHAKVKPKQKLLALIDRKTENEHALSEVEYQAIAIQAKALGWSEQKLKSVITERVPKALDKLSTEPATTASKNNSNAISKSAKKSQIPQQSNEEVPSKSSNGLVLRLLCLSIIVGLLFGGYSYVNQHKEMTLVGQIQDYLNRLGYKTPTHGELDKRTEGVIRAFELDQNKIVTGAADLVLLKSLTDLYNEKDQEFWNKAKKEHTDASYNSYAKNYPKGRFSQQVNQQIVLAKEDTLWAQVKNTNEKKSYKKYLIQYPSGRYQVKTEQALTNLEETLWKATLMKNSVDSYHRYKKNYPQGKYIAEVDKRIETVETAQKHKEVQRLKELAYQKQKTIALRVLIKNTQTELNRLGYKVGRPDGQLGDETKKAIGHYQKGYKLKLTRSVSESLLTHLEQAANKPKLVAGETFKDCSDCPEMVVIPSGSFHMGSNEGNSHEKPIHKVKIIKPFAMGQYEVSWNNYQPCIDAGECISNRSEGWGKGNRPVIDVSWYDAQSYIKWLNKKTGKNYRLANEAEWEYAARAGSANKYSWGNDINCSQASYGYYSGQCGKQKGTDLIGTFSANTFGLYDMHGNVYEWVQDCWNSTYSGAPSTNTTWEGGNCKKRVLRGGSWGSGPLTLSSASRIWFTASHGNPNYGFRLVLGL